MLRIVKMEFQQGKENEFLHHFRSSAARIRSFPGCHSVQLLRDRHRPGVFFTYSEWEDEEALENYRSSDFFATTWKKVKPLFSCQARAWSVDKIS